MKLVLLNSNKTAFATIERVDETFFINDKEVREEEMNLFIFKSFASSWRAKHIENILWCESIEEYMYADTVADCCQVI